MNVLQRKLHKTFYKSGRLHGFISLPIIALLLFITALSHGFYQTLIEERQWRYQQQTALNDQTIWQAFEQDIVLNATDSMVTTSQCDGFCAITNLHDNDWLQEYEFLANNQLEKLYWFFTKSSKKEAYRRLCAWRKETNEKTCWWYKQNSVTHSQAGSQASAQANVGTLILIGSMPMQ